MSAKDLYLCSVAHAVTTEYAVAIVGRDYFRGACPAGEERILIL